MTREDHSVTTIWMFFGFEIALCHIMLYYVVEFFVLRRNRLLTQSDSQTPITMAVEVPQGWVPTFALKPKDNERFLPKQAKQVVEELVEKSCKGLTYAADKCQAMAMQLAEQIRDALHSSVFAFSFFESPFLSVFAALLLRTLLLLYSLGTLIFENLFTFQFFELSFLVSMSSVFCPSQNCLRLGTRLLSNQLLAKCAVRVFVFHRAACGTRKPIPPSRSTGTMYAHHSIISSLFLVTNTT
jgi:hypothetical protein